MPLRTSASFVTLVLLSAAFMGCSSSDSSIDASTSPKDGIILPDAPIPDTSPPARVYNGPLFMRRAEAGELKAFQLDEVVVDGNGELVLPAGGGHAGQDPYAAGTYHGGNYYNGGSYRTGTARSTEWTSSQPFDAVIPSFEAATPPGTWIAVSLSVRVDGIWTKDYVLGVWASSTQTVKRHSVDGQDDAAAAVKVDTLAINGTADALRFIVQLFAENGVTPRVRSVAAIVSNSSAPKPNDTPTPAARGKVLDVPQRSQEIYPEGAASWCSPTSTSMLLAYWAAKLGKPELNETVPAAVDLVYDHTSGLKGNWVFNMAHASSIGSGALHAVVTRMSSLNQLERLIAADIPVAISVESAQGHLLVVRGFTESGDVVCNDPASPSDAEVQVTYPRAELEGRWQYPHSQGTTYLVWPVGTELPVDPLGAF